MAIRTEIKDRTHTNVLFCFLNPHLHIFEFIYRHFYIHDSQLFYLLIKLSLV